MNTPVLFLVFNRPDLTAMVFEQIREAKPKQLFIAADGPRQEREGEVALCEETRQVVLKKIDWDCKVKTLFRDSNLGCKIAVSEAITWFFENVQEGIILEDDCLPDPSFFRFCSELLTHYRNDRRIMSVCGANFQDGYKRGEASYYFSTYSQIWGWASWRRAWDLYDRELRRWKELRGTLWLAGITGGTSRAEYFKNYFDLVASGELDTWDLQWNFACWTNHELVIIPNVNLITNIGYDYRATHTTFIHSTDANRPNVSVEFPLCHPFSVMRDYEADDYTALHQYGIDSSPRGNPSLARRIRGRLRRICDRIKSTPNLCNNGLH